MYEITAKEIREKREKLGISLEGLARRLGVSLNTVWRWENSDREDLSVERRKPPKLSQTALYLLFEKLEKERQS